MQVRRAMEKENNKCRAEKRRKHNECVRALVAHVKKRDKRVAARQVQQAEEQALALTLATCSRRRTRALALTLARCSRRRSRRPRRRHSPRSGRAAPQSTRR